MFNLKYTNLFGRFSYDIMFNDDVTILTGPNGYGKSTILKTLEAISEGISGINFFIKLNFDKMELINQETNEKLVIEKENDNIVINNEVLNVKFFMDFVYYLIRRDRYFIKKIDDNKYLDIRKDKVYTYDEYINLKYLNNIIFKENEDITSDFELHYEISKKYKSSEISKYLKVVKKIINYKKMLKNIYFIKEQRLIIINDKENEKKEDDEIEFINQLPKKLKNIITEVSNRYSEVSNQLDSSYPFRLLSSKDGIDEKTYEKEMERMKEKMDKIKKFDISDIQPIANLEFKTEHAKALKIYFEDFQKKYNVYEDLLKKLDLYTEIINSRLSFKEIKISRENGIIVLDSNDNKIELNKLSSGEQQEIVLFYKLIFDVKESELLLIDEPEISLHIVWQRKFMDDLIRIIEFKKISVIVATHSPQIISEHLDKQVDLGQLFSNEFNNR